MIFFLDCKYIFMEILREKSNKRAQIHKFWFLIFPLARAELIVLKLIALR